MIIRSLRKIAFLASLMLSLLLGIALLFAQLAWGGAFNNELELSLVPTAENLLLNPIPTLSSIRSIIPSVGTQIGGTEAICIAVRVPSEQAQIIANWSGVYLNNQRISRSDLRASYISDLADFSITTLKFCFKTDLARGYHILELRLAASVLETFGLENAETYTWAYEVR